MNEHEADVDAEANVLPKAAQGEAIVIVTV